MSRIGTHGGATRPRRDCKTRPGNRSRKRINSPLNFARFRVYPFTPDSSGGIQTSRAKSALWRACIPLSLGMRSCVLVGRIADAPRESTRKRALNFGCADHPAEAGCKKRLTEADRTAAGFIRTIPQFAVHSQGSRLFRISAELRPAPDSYRATAPWLVFGTQQSPVRRVRLLPSPAAQLRGLLPPWFP